MIDRWQKEKHLDPSQTVHNAVWPQWMSSILVTDVGLFNWNTFSGQIMLVVNDYKLNKDNMLVVDHCKYGQWENRDINTRC